MSGMAYLSCVSGLGAATGVCDPGIRPGAKNPVAVDPVADDRPTRSEQKGPAEAVDAKHLPNAFRLHPKIISGGLPGAQGFAELKALGVRTIISVDGAEPDVAEARKHGLRYVHLPHGYDSVPQERVRELAIAFQELPGPIYIHCHHGKHRSPAAATSACIAAGLVPSKNGLALLKQLGTSTAYRGLYRSVSTAKKLPDQELKPDGIEFPEVAQVSHLAKAMVELEHTWDRLKKLQANNWKLLEDEPDLDPAHEALIFREHATELLRHVDSQREPGYIKLLQSMKSHAQQLEDLLPSRPSPENPSVAIQQSRSRVIQAIEANCRQCHVEYRN